MTEDRDMKEKEATERPRREQVEEFKPCRKSKCPVCNLLKNQSPVTSVISLATGEHIKVNGRLTCTSNNPIYCITCRRGGRVCSTHHQFTGRQVSS